MVNPFKILEHNRLTYQLAPFSARQLLFLERSPVDIFGMSKGIFDIVVRRDEEVSKDLIRDLIEQNLVQIFIKQDEVSKLIQMQQSNLRKVTRSLSVGSPLKNGKLQMNLMTIHLEFLYQRPTDDEALSLQYQCAKNLASFLLANQDLHVSLYKDYQAQKHHFIYAQPMISSLLLLGVLGMAKSHNPREIEQLFITSYLKDIGMSSIPAEKYNQKELSDHEKKIFNNHPRQSLSILTGRTPLSSTHLKIIENHHIFSRLQDKTSPLIDLNHSGQLLYGTETVMVSVMDIVAAMSTGRPFRPATSLFDALDYIRLLMADDYSQEFRHIVKYFKKFK